MEMRWESATASMLAASDPDMLIAKTAIGGMVVCLAAG